VLAGQQEGGCACGCCAFCGNLSANAHRGLTDPTFVLEGERVSYGGGMAVDGMPPAFATPDPRWGATASLPTGPFPNGSATILTYSFVPDGTPIPGYAGEADAPSNLFARMRSLYASSGTNDAERDAVWQGLIESALTSWGRLAGVTYVREMNDDGQTLGGSNTAGLLGTRGDVRISGHRIDGNSGILAYNFFPASGADMVIDTADNFYADKFNDSLGLRNVIAHEAGHGLGFRHTDPINETKLMEAFASYSFDGPQFDDNLLANFRYGDRFEGPGRNNTTTTATTLGTLPRGTTNVTGLSTSTGSDVDVFRITLTENSRLRISSTPVGGTYQSGPQNGTTTSFNARSVHDLKLSLQSVGGSVIVSDQDLFGIGATELIPNVLLSAGDYYVSVSTDTSSASTAQMYDLGFEVTSLTPAPPTLADASDSGVKGDNKTNALRPTFTGTGAAPGATMELFVDGVLAGSAVAAGNGTYSVTLSSDVSVGTRAIRVRQIDLSSVTSDQSAALSVLFDVTVGDLSAPVLAAASDTGTSDSDRLTSDVRPRFQGTGADADATISLFANGVLVGTGTANMAGAYIVQPTNALAEGTYSFTVKQTDVVGNTSAAFSTPGVSVTIDTTAPTDLASVPVLAPASDSGVSQSDGITSVTAPLVSGTAAANSLVQLLVSGVVVASTTTDSSGAYSISLGTLVDGTYLITARRSDDAGNAGPASDARTVRIDTTVSTPGLPVLSAASDTGVPGDDQTGLLRPVFIGGGAEPGATLQLLVDGVLAGSSVVLSDGTFSVTPTADIAAGSRAITVRQSDLAGNLSGVSPVLGVVIDPTAPTLVGGASVVVTENTSFSRTLGTVSIPSPKAIYSVSVNWGDGTPTVVVLLGQGSSNDVSVVGNGQGGFNIVGTHTYFEPGSYTITLQAQAAAGGVATATTTAVVANLAIGSSGGGVISGGFTIAAVEGIQSALQTVATFTDPAGEGDPADYAVSINWGDGNTTEGDVNYNPTTRVYTVRGRNVFADTGTFNVTVSVAESGSTATAVSSASVANALLTVGVASNITANEGGTYSGRVISFSNEFVNESIDEITAAITFGDGTQASGVITADPGVPGNYIVSTTKTYNASGTFSGTVTITDDEGGFLTASFQSTIANVAPTVTASAAADLFVGEAVALTVVGQEVGPADLAAGLTFVVNWGDGSEPTTTRTASGVSTAVISHTYATTGTFAVAVTVTDQDGGSSTFNTSLVVVPLPTVSAASFNGGASVGAASHIQSLAFTLSSGDAGNPALTKSNLTLLHNGNRVIDLTNVPFVYQQATGVVSLDLSGVSLPDGDYQMQIRFSGGTILPVDFVKLTGDVDGNGRVDGRDRRSVALLIGTASSVSAGATNADVNGDGTVTNADAELVRANLGKRTVLRTTTFGINARRGPTLNFGTIKSVGAGIIDVVLVNNFRQARGIGELRIIGEETANVQVVGQVWNTSITSLPMLQPGESVRLRIYANGSPETSGRRPIVGNLSIVHANITRLDSRRFEASLRGRFEF
jgi:hypothetical protein